MARFLMPYRVERGVLPALVTYDETTAKREATKYGSRAERGKICIWPLRHKVPGGLISDYTTFDAQEIVLLGSVDPLWCCDQEIPSDVKPAPVDPPPDLNLLSSAQLIELGAKHELFINRKWKREQMIEHLCAKLGDKVRA